MIKRRFRYPIKAVNLPYYLQTIEGTVYGDIKKYLNKSRAGKSLLSTQIAYKARMWHDVLVKDYGYGTSKDWQGFLKLLDNMTSFPDSFKSGYGNEELSKALVNFTKLLISSEVSY